MFKENIQTISLIFLVLLLSDLSCQLTKPADWEFDNNYKKKMVFVHGFANYDLTPQWQMLWEKNLFKTNGLQTSYGSVTVKDLNSELKLSLNMDLGNGWWFRSSFLRSQIQFRDNDKEYNYLGFEKRLYKTLSVFSLCNATYDKEEIDILLGLSLLSTGSEQYIRLALTYDDFLYDEKNPSSGKVTGEPLGIEWHIRLGSDKLWFYSEGKYMNPFKIDFKNNDNAEIFFSSKQINDLTAKFYYFIKEDQFTELRLVHHHFSRKELHYLSEFSYSYLNEIYDLVLKYHHQFTDNFAVRPVLHFVIQNAVASGVRDYNYTRRELIPMFISEYNIADTKWEIGILRSSYDLELDDLDDNLSYERENSTIKFMLRWTYQFNPETRLQFSLSHVPEIEGFGGGNLNFMMFF